ncbi:Hypothetical protein BN2458_PEG1236 [Helicobacter typhlonius]|uniref:Uncharacterized protein n=1 Tax=Helicobacter typhlonius TaxID=76936 RepID=A0A0S4PV39_9HELI|nr:Hypothetical protein BN2458_PEG1236 [Helicobacter typhlonius]
MKFLPILRGEIGVIQGMWARVWLVCRVGIFEIYNEII